MNVFVYSMREYDELPLFEKHCMKYGMKLGYTVETPSLNNAEYAEGYDIIDIITTKFTAEMIQKYASLGVKCIATRTIGFDHIDVDAARACGIKIVNAVYPPESVSEYTVMMILMGLRKIKHITMRSQVQDYSLEGKLAGVLSNKTVGVIGTGRIGEALVRNLSGFGCKIMCYDPFPKKFPEEIAQYVELDKLLRESDIISLHTPLMDDNYHMLDKRAFDMMKDGVGIVNCARGPLIDSDALIEAIESRKVGFACLDVVEHEHGLYYFNRMGEPLNNPRLAILQSYSNVIVTPHMAFYTDEAVENMVEHSLINSKNALCD